MSMTRNGVNTVACMTTALAAACATGDGAQGTQARLAPPAGEVLVLHTLAVGVQTYECAASASGPAWTFKEPRAALVDASGHPVGRHYAGPTWEAADGSTVVGRVVASVDSADASAIPHLLLASKGNAGEGIFARVRSIQRVETSGGRAPKEPCATADIGRRAQTPYSATYNFYGAAEPARGPGY